MQIEYSDYTKKMIAETYRRLPAAYKNKPKFVDTLEKIVYFLTDPVGRTKIDTNPQTATGYSLDIIGARLKLARDGMVDEDYRARILLELALRNPDMTHKGISEKFKLLYNCQQFYMALADDNILVGYASFENGLPTDFSALKKILPGGVNFVLNATTGNIIFYIDDFGNVDYGTAIAADDVDEGILLATEDNLPICANIFETQQVS